MLWPGERQGDGLEWRGDAGDLLRLGWHGDQRESRE